MKIFKNYYPKNIILTASMALALTSFMPLSTFASVNLPIVQSEIEQLDNTSSISHTSLLEINEITGSIAPSVDTLFDEVSTLSFDESPTLSNLTFNYENQQLILNGTLSLDNETIDFQSHGTLYKNEATDNAYTYDNLILGEMSDFDNIHFVQLKLDNDDSCIYITFEEKDTNRLMQFQVPINSNLFDVFYNTFDNTLDGTELEEKILKLYSIGNNLTTSTNLGFENSTSSEITSTTDV